LLSLVQFFETEGEELADLVLEVFKGEGRRRSEDFISQAGKRGAGAGRTVNSMTLEEDFAFRRDFGRDWFSLGV
jgi:hypothetical protein